MKRVLLLLVIIFFWFLPPAYGVNVWSTISSGVYLNGIWGSSGTDIFAVGSSGTIRHYNGSSWGVMTSGTTNALYGVWGSSGTDVFAVGSSGAFI